MLIDDCIVLEHFNEFVISKSVSPFSDKIIYFKELRLSNEKIYCTDSIINAFTFFNKDNAIAMRDLIKSCFDIDFSVEEVTNGRTRIL